MVEELNMVFNTSNTSMSQCDRTEQFIINLFSQELRLSVCELIAFKKKIKNIDVTALFHEEHAGVEIVPLPHCDRFFVFSIREILELRDLLEGSFAMLELNSLLKNRLGRIQL